MVETVTYQHPTEIPLSKALVFDWTGDRIPVSTEGVHGDTHPLTWAEDDGIYVGTGDPNWAVVDGQPTPMVFQRWQGLDEAAGISMGLSVEEITGAPEHFEVSRVNDMPGFVGPGGHGPKPSGMICVDGVLYYAVQNLLGLKSTPHRPGSQHGTDATILRSTDHGQTWEPDLNPLLDRFMHEQYVAQTETWLTTEAERTGYDGWEPMFPGSEFGGPSFVQFGKNNEEAVDGYVYAVSTDQWDNGRFLRLGRVPQDAIMDRDAWEFAALGEDGEPSWHRDIAESGPILDIEGHVSLPEMVYISSLKKYILLTWGLHTDFSTPTGSELTILEADHPWGPFSLVHYEWMWFKRESCAYTPRIPLKWFDQDSLEGYILHSGNWGFGGPNGEWLNPMFHYYLPQVRKFRFGRREDVPGMQA